MEEIKYYRKMIDILSEYMLDYQKRSLATPYDALFVSHIIALMNYSEEKIVKEMTKKLKKLEGGIL